VSFSAYLYDSTKAHKGLCSHFDHLDIEAVKELGDSCEWFVPIGVGKFLRKFGVTRIRELE